MPAYTCWRCGGREKPFYALRTPEHFAGRICAPCSRSFKLWCDEGSTFYTPAVTTLPESVKESLPARLERRTRETEEREPVKTPDKPAVPKSKPQPAEYKKPEKGQRAKYQNRRESLEDKVARMRKKWGTPTTKAEQIEDEMYAEDFGDS